MAYLLDADVFIAAKNLHYGFDFCPAFWDWLILKHQEGVVFSVERVGDELAAGEDRLSEWVQERPTSFFRGSTDAHFPSFNEVRRWVEGHGYRPTAIDAFLQSGDYHLVGQAHNGRHTVVTQEKPAATPRRVKVPDACMGVGVKCVNTFQMLRMEQAQFVLGSSLV